MPHVQIIRNDRGQGAGCMAHEVARRSQWGLPPWAAYGPGSSRAAGDRGTATTGAGDRRRCDCVSGVAWQAAEYHCGDRGGVAGVLSPQRVAGISRSVRKVTFRPCRIASDSQCGRPRCPEIVTPGACQTDCRCIAGKGPSLWRPCQASNPSTMKAPSAATAQPSDEPKSRSNTKGSVAFRVALLRSGAAKGVIVRCSVWVSISKILSASRPGRRFMCQIAPSTDSSALSVLKSFQLCNPPWASTASVNRSFMRLFLLSR
jgi:hypothetical protein